MKITKERLSEWSVSGIVGGTALTLVSGIVSVVTGSWAVVWPFVFGHPLESLACALVVLGAGMLVGAVISLHFSKKQLARIKKECAAKLAERDRDEAEIERRRKIKGFSKAQLEAMLNCYCEESIGMGGIKRGYNDPVTSFLVQEGVMVEAGGDYARSLASYTLTHEWRVFVVENEADIRRRIEGIGK